MKAKKAAEGDSVAILAQVDNCVTSCLISKFKSLAMAMKAAMKATKAMKAMKAKKAAEGDAAPKKAMKAMKAMKATKKAIRPRSENERRGRAHSCNIHCFDLLDILYVLLGVYTPCLVMSRRSHEVRLLLIQEVRTNG